ncbi:MAG: tryptophan 7-halogenase [Elusimicrobiota bacterium]|nr:MAG: tryptophan 7-halogenase [Elusimicrobiota bacterium]
MNNRPHDLIVIGAGPAGCTLATLVKKYAPERRVLLLEKEAGPRHHIGESLLPGIVPVLKEMGVFEKVDGAGFPKKIGANYVWGAGRKVWENDFNEVNVTEMIRRFGKIPERIEYAWQVRRSRYDEILLKHAEESGVEVVRGAKATGIIEKDGAIAGLETLEPGGPRRREAEFVADCSGQAGFLSKYREIRGYHASLRNVAGYAYYRGAKWKYTYSGHPDKTKIFVCSVGPGWFWYIPIDDGVVSVGLVTTVENLKKSGLELEALFARELAACDELAPLMTEAERVENFDGSGQSFFSHSDWSYLNRAAAGPGWLAAGDAAIFVDPILSTGVTLAHVGAHRAAYTLISQWAAGAAERELLWKDYGAFCRESAAQYFVMALFWYGHDKDASKWWAEAGRIQRAWLPVVQSDKAAFVTVSAGLTQHYDRLFSASSLLDETPTRPEDYPFYVEVLKNAPGGAPVCRFGDGDAPRLLTPFDVSISFLPAGAGGRLKPVKRARFLKEDPGDSVRDALNPRRFVTRWHEVLLAALDGSRTMGELGALLAGKDIPAWWWEGPGRRFVEELAVQGVLGPAVAERA